MSKTIEERAKEYAGSVERIEMSDYIPKHILSKLNILNLSNHELMRRAYIKGAKEQQDLCIEAFCKCKCGKTNCEIPCGHFVAFVRILMDGKE